MMGTLAVPLSAKERIKRVDLNISYGEWKRQQRREINDGAATIGASTKINLDAKHAAVIGNAADVGDRIAELFGGGRAIEPDALCGDAAVTEHYYDRDATEAKNERCGQISYVLAKR